MKLKMLHFPLKLGHWQNYKADTITCICKILMQERDDVVRMQRCAQQALTVFQCIWWKTYVQKHAVCQMG